MAETAGEVIHWPDYKFAEYCRNRYRINRGVYNTIDVWLYEHGCRDIGERRRLILLFLAACSEQADEEDGKFLKFGKGGLTDRIRQYVFGARQAGSRLVH
ncbi:hypothetical protein [Thermobacillus composti]|jgi:hypothetical protein|uniref:hypothetical protein n=1 Tax=Thermobacillus composti TaxID=377615 RepID=UPI00022C47D6|nr:hypothetical protein [Thermobacillus composti]